MIYFFLIKSVSSVRKSGGKKAFNKALPDLIYHQV